MCGPELSAGILNFGMLQDDPVIDSSSAFRLTLLITTTFRSFVRLFLPRPEFLLQGNSSLSRMTSMTVRRGQYFLHRQILDRCSRVDLKQARP